MGTVMVCSRIIDTLQSSGTKRIISLNAAKKLCWGHPARIILKVKKCS